MRQVARASIALVMAPMVLDGARAQAPASPDQPTFRTGTTLIEASAIVTRAGQPVTDLRADEVTTADAHSDRYCRQFVNAHWRLIDVSWGALARSLPCPTPT